MDLRELFDEVATENEPPTSLSADRAYRDGRRRSAWRTAFTGTAAAGAVIAAVVGATTVLGGSGGPARPANPPPAPADLSGVRWAGTWDGTHLYAGQYCPNAVTCTTQLVGSDDGGRTWTRRGTPKDPPDPYVLGAHTLLGAISHEVRTGSSGGAERTYSLSTDGGRTWSNVTLGGASAAKVPAGGYLMCMGANGPSCKLYAIDPAHLRAAPLATQPDGVVDGEAIAPQAAGGPLWAVGSLGSGKVAVSLDDGRTWRTTTALTCPTTTLGVWTGGPPGTAGVICLVGGPGNLVRASRTHDNGATWQPVDMPAQQPFGSATDEVGAYMLHDGTVIVAQHPTDGSVARLWSLSPGATSWRAVPTSGLPPYATIFEFDHDGSVLAHGSGLGHFDLYRSTDLRTWTRLDTGP